MGAALPFIPTAISAATALFGGGNKSNGAAGVGASRDNLNQMGAETKARLDALNPQQEEFGKALAAGALGKGPSIADAQMKLAMEQSLQQQLAAAQAQRGVNPALAGRNAQMAAAQTNLGISGQGVANKLQEQQNKQNQFANYLSGQQNLQMQAFGGAGNQASNYAQAQLAQNQNTNQLNGGALQGVAQGLAAGFGASGGKSAPDNYESSYANDVGNSSVVADNAPRQLGNAMVNGMAKGGLVSGPELKTGDHPANDVVPAKLSGGEIVIPKSIVEKGGKAAGAFVDALKQHYEQQEKIKKMSYGDVLAAKNKKGG